MPNIGQFNFITCQVRVFYPGVSIEHLERQTNRTQTESNDLFIFTKEAPKKPSLPAVKQCFGRTQSINKDSVVL